MLIVNGSVGPVALVLLSSYSGGNRKEEAGVGGWFVRRVKNLKCDFIVVVNL